MGNRIAVEKTPIDWSSDNLKLFDKNKGYPQKYQQYLHTWRCYPSETDPDLIETQPFSILNANNIELQSNEAYIIVHIHSTQREQEKSKLIKKEVEYEREHTIHKIIQSIQTTVNPISTKHSIISDDVNKKLAKIKPHFDIYVWSGKDSTIITQSVAIAKAYSYEELLINHLTTMGVLPFLVQSELVPCSNIIKEIKEAAIQLTPFNTLLANLFNPNFGRPKTSAGRSASLPFAFKRNTSNDVVNKSFSSLSLQKVPLLEIATTTEKTETNIKLDKLKLYAKRCSNIAPNIYLSGEEVAYDKNILEENQISNIINCAGTYCVNLFGSEFEYFTVNLYDSENEDISGFFLLVIEYVEEVLRKKGKVLFHCQQGVSRSSTLLIMYLMWKNKESLDITHKRVKQIREISNPNLGFIYQLILWEKILFSTSTLYPLVSFVVPHSATDLIFILKKSPNNILDPRGIFLIQTAEALFKWVGAKASEKLHSPTEDYIARLQKYMNVSTNVITIEQDHTQNPDFQKLSFQVKEAPEFDNYFQALSKIQ